MPYSYVCVGIATQIPVSNIFRFVKSLRGFNPTCALVFWGRPEDLTEDVKLLYENFNVTVRMLLVP